jgi:7-cyano-7-deazaguanine reductase
MVEEKKAAVQVKKDDVSKLKSLGSKKTEYPNDTGIKPELLEKIPNLYPDHLYVDSFETDEFTSLCPRTAQPDFAKIRIRYMPDQFMVESKSLKLYMFSFRSAGMFMESITNLIAKHLVECIQPWHLLVVAEFNARGGLKTIVKVRYSREKGFKADVGRDLDG